jgi:hypothetical protein
VVQLLNERTLTPDDFSYYELAEACGILPRLRSLRESFLPLDGRLASAGAITHLLSESSVGTNLFQVVTGELIARKVMEGYEDDAGFIGDQLVTVLPSKHRGTKIAGFRALTGPTEVQEGEAYEESSFQEKFVTSIESKQGRILSINEELIAFDQTGVEFSTSQDQQTTRPVQFGIFLAESVCHALSKNSPAAGRFPEKPDEAPVDQHRPSFQFSVRQQPAWESIQD